MGDEVYRLGFVLLGVSVLPEYVSQSKGFVSLFYMVGSLFQKAVYNICVPLCPARFREMHQRLWFLTHQRRTEYTSGCLMQPLTLEVRHGRRAELC